MIAGGGKGGAQTYQGHNGSGQVKRRIKKSKKPLEESVPKFE